MDGTEGETDGIDWAGCCVSVLGDSMYVCLLIGVCTYHRSILTRSIVAVREGLERV